MLAWLTFQNHSCEPNLSIVQAYTKVSPLRATRTAVMTYASEGSDSARGGLADHDQDYHPERPTLAIFATQDISAGEELCISYIGTVSLGSTLLLLIPCTT